MYTLPRFVEREDKICVRDIDKSVKNKWNWSWLETSVGDIAMDAYIRKLPAPEKAYCLWCQSSINYSTSGIKALRSHASSDKHCAHISTRKSNYRLTGNYYLI